MITPELAYFLKVNIAIALFYAFYRLFFDKDTFFHLRRTVLLCFFAISFIYPTLNCQDWIKSHEPMVAMADLYASVVLPEVNVVAQKATTNWHAIISSAILYMYAAGIILLSGRFLIQLFCILRLRLHCSTAIIDKIKVHVPDRANGPFSFFHWIFIHPDLHSTNELSEILTHEQTHVRQYHSLDVLFSEIVCIVCWFNPFVWLMKREIRNNLEYMADNHVLQTGHDSKSYQYHLLGLAHQRSTTHLSNNFNVLSLKNRIKMMNKKRTSEIGRTKYLMFVPLAILLMIISNIEAVARTTREIAQEVIQTVKEQIEPARQPASAGEVTQVPLPEHISETDDAIEHPQPVNVENTYEIVEEMPGFPGGAEALMAFIRKNTHYPVAAQTNGTQGRVIVQFVIEKDGTPSHHRIVHSVDPKLDAEAIQIVRKMPKWTPGKQNGKAVAVKYTIPISFVTQQNTAEISNVKEEKPEVATTGNEASSPSVPNVIFDVVEVMPQFIGGTNALREYLANNIRYPAKAQESGEQGRVIVELVIGKEGGITHTKVVRSVSPALDAEAIRVVNNMPAWIPGQQRGQNVSVKYTLPIVFRLS